MKQDDTLGFMFLLVIISIIVCIVLWFIAAIGAMNTTDGCLYRYSFVPGSDISGQTLSNTDTITQTITLKANGNYSLTQTTVGEAGFELDPNEYGKWVNTNIITETDQQIEVEVRGEASLCKAYVPTHNLQQVSNLDSDNKKIAIPRVDDLDSEPISLIFDATTDEWRNITELFPNDRYVVAIWPNRKEDVAATTREDIFTGNDIVADCRAGNTSYNPICGKFSIYSGSFVDSCNWNSDCYDCNCRRKCKEWNIAGIICIGGYHTVCDRCGCWENVNGVLPDPYLNDGSNSFEWSDNLNSLKQNYTYTCSSSAIYINSSAYQNNRKFWYSADDAAGLVYRYDGSENPSSKNQLGSNYQFAEIKDYGDQISFYGDDSVYQVLLDDTCENANTCGNEGVHYLQYRFISENPADYDGHTGGYVLNIKQTKCRRSNGIGVNDSIANRGAVEYVIMPYEQNPNDTAPGSATTLNVSSDGKGTIIVPANSEGYIWMRIKNDPNDYVDSFGQYAVEFTLNVPRDSFFEKILNPLVTMLKTKIQTAAETIFKNMTCYQGAGEDDNCTNFFDYIRAMLTLYIIAYGFLFLLGNVQISQTDIVIRVIKVGFVAGLMNEKTFTFFNDYVFVFVTGFSDDIISNMGGYSIFTAGSTINNPFSFLSSVLNKVFLSQTFGAQMMALLALGMNGVLYFIIIFVTLIMLVIVLFRAITVYMMAFMALAVLIGLAPLFLTFMLFNFTWYLFDNWLKFTFRYMIEPVIMLAGIIILTQLFTIYLDQVVGYSICWKCVIPVKIPFPNIPGLDSIFTDIEIFCINWFAPWGFDQRTGQMGLNMQHIAALVMLAYALWNYIEFSGRIVANLVVAGGPSATHMGGAMSGAIGQKALSKVGLDASTRNQIKQKAQQRLKDLSRGKARAELNKNNRFDVSPEDDKKTRGDKKSDKTKDQEQIARAAKASDAGKVFDKDPSSEGRDDAKKGKDDKGNEKIAKAATAADANKPFGSDQDDEGQAAADKFKQEKMAELDKDKLDDAKVKDAAARAGGVGNAEALAAKLKEDNKDNKVDDDKLKGKGKGDGGDDQGGGIGSGDIGAGDDAGGGSGNKAREKIGDADNKFAAKSADNISQAENKEMPAVGDKKDQKQQKEPDAEEMNVDQGNNDQEKEIKEQQRRDIGDVNDDISSSDEEYSAEDEEAFKELEKKAEEEYMEENVDIDDLNKDEDFNIDDDEELNKAKDHHKDLSDRSNLGIDNDLSEFEDELDELNKDDKNDKKK